tara:strand:- start:1348 stop:1794 length:447 start_codon:yes stop_codon:yes gene_type:complete
MALAASGQISISQINTELGRTSTTTNTSLAQCSDGTNGTINTANATANRPNTTAPHSMSEFYSYNHLLSSVTLFYTTYNEEELPCGSELATKYHHDGNNILPIIGDTIFGDENGTEAGGDGYYLTSTYGGVQVTKGNGIVAATFNCKK